MADGGHGRPMLDDAARPFPEHLAPLWDALPERTQARIQGPWENSAGKSLLDQTKAMVTILRACGWALDHVLELASIYPDGLGSLRSAAATAIADIWRQRDEDLVQSEVAAQGLPPGAVIGSFQLLAPSDLQGLPERGYLLKGIMSPGELSVWWGPPKCGKSFLLLHIAYALAQGRSVFGRRVKPCRVLYVACEGKTGLRARMEALTRRYGAAAEFRAIAQPVDLGPAATHVDDLRLVIAYYRPDLVVVDTINRVMAGGDENSSADMGALIRHLDELRQPLEGQNYGPHVACVHHGTKEGRNGPRGHGSLLGAVDASIEVSADEDGSRTAKLDAMKDDARGALAFRLGVVDLGEDEDGDPRTTCAVEEEAAPEARKRKGKALTETQAAWFRDLADMFAEPGKAALRVPIEGMSDTLTLTRAEVRAGFRVRGRFDAEAHANLTDNDRRKLTDTLNVLRDRGKIGMAADLVWLT